MLASYNPGNDLEELLRESKCGLGSLNGDDDQLFANALELCDRNKRSNMAAKTKKLLHEVFSGQNSSKTDSRQSFKIISFNACPGKPKILSGMAMAPLDRGLFIPAKGLLTIERTYMSKESDQILKNKRILVTGACGTIGQELVRQLLENFEISELIGIDNNESELFFSGAALFKASPCALFPGGHAGTGARWNALPAI